MKTAVLSIKVDEHVKKRAYKVAAGFGFPLSTLVNAYLMELAETGQIHFTRIEPMTQKMEKIIEQAERDIATGHTTEPFETAEDAIAHLKSL